MSTYDINEECEYMAKDVRLSAPGLRVLRFLLERPRENYSGAEISRAVCVGSGTLYPFLARLEKAGWLRSEWEVVDPSESGRPRRRFYRLTGLGQTNSAKALVEVQTAPGALVWNS